MNTRCEYLYRDDANYKRFGGVLLSGAISPTDRALIESKMEMGELFVAEQVGLPSLKAEWFAEGARLSADDNDWHWLVSISSVDDDGATLMKTSELVERFRTVATWQVGLAEAATY